MSIHSAISDSRYAHNVSRSFPVPLSALGKALGVSAMAVSRWENGDNEPPGEPLFGWLGLVFFQNRVDHADPRSQLGPLRWLFPPVARRNRITQHLAYRHAGQSKLPRYRPLTSALN